MAYRIMIWALVLAGLALLIAWMLSVALYGVEVDERSLAPTVRIVDVVLLAGAIGCLAAAVSVPIVRNRRARRAID